MARRGDVPRRSEVTDRVERNANDLQEKAEASETVVEDAETVCDIRDKVELGGTAEGADEVTQALESAEDTAVEIFEDRDADVEEEQQESEEHEDELRERLDSTESDSAKLDDANGRIHTAEVAGKNAETKDAVTREIEFLDTHKQREAEGREQSERIQNEHDRRVQAARSAR